MLCARDRFATLNNQKPSGSSRPAAVVVKPREGSVSGSSTASIDTNATTPTSTGDKKKRKKKKNSKNSVSSGGDNQETNGHSNGSSDANGKRKSIFAVHDGENQESTDPSQLPLSKRLEIAASHSDIHAALVGLLGWSRLYVNTDTIMEFFQSRALEMLLENIFQACPATDAIYDNLNALLANCLSNERDGKPSSSNRGIANSIVAAVRSIVDKLRGSSNQLLQDDVSVEKAAQYLSKIVLNYRLSLNGIDMGSALSQEILRIDAELATAAAKDGAVKGQAIRDTFQRRDIRCEALALYESRLAKINKLVEDNISSSTQHLQAGKEGQKQLQNGSTDSDCTSYRFSAFAANEEDNQLSELDPKELEAIKQQLTQLSERKAAEIAPLVAKREVADAVLHDLKKKREELEAQLRALNREIDDNACVQQELDEQIASVEEKFEDETSRFDNEHQHVIQQYQRKERCEQIDATFSELQDAITNISLEHSDVQSLKDKRVVCMRQHLEGILRYFASELPCVKFMMGRVEQSEAQLKKYTDEAQGYKALGVSAVAKELLEKATMLRSHIDEDKSCLQALHKRDLELLDTTKRLFCDPEHADSFSAQEPTLTTEVQRHVDYARKLYEPLLLAASNGDSSDAKPSSPAKNGAAQKK